MAPRGVIRVGVLLCVVGVLALTFFSSRYNVQSQVSSLVGGPYERLLNMRENAAFVTLARNNELDKLLPSIESYEKYFNSRYHYDWVFLNDEEFTPEFKAAVQSKLSGTAKFGKIDPEHWSIPSWVDVPKAEAAWKQMEDDHIIYGGSQSYRHMCRFESGFFYDHPIMKPYRFYWRVEPETALRCKVKYDVFRFIRENGIKYTWTISIKEFESTIRSLWSTTLDFIRENPQYVSPNNLAGFVSNDGMESYNLCHFWSNFEIADLEFWRGDAYKAYFNFLDKTGNFFYERWGDAPVHSIAAALFLSQDEVYFFDDIGYSHPPFTHCPTNQGMRGLECDCDDADPRHFDNLHFDWHESSCLRRYLNAKDVLYFDPNPNEE